MKKLLIASLFVPLLALGQGILPPPLATQAQAEAGANNQAYMSPLRTAQAIAAQGGGGGAPTNATYITQTPNGGLSNEQALNALSSGIMRVATTTGVITSLTDSAGIAANISDETGTGALVFGTAPTITLGNATGLPLTTGVTGILPVANGGTNNAFFTVSGPASSAKTYTFPNSNATILYSGGDAGTPSALVGTNISGTAANLTAGSVTNGVTAASTFGTDNRLLRSDGTGRGAQSTGITVDDSDNMTGVSSITTGTVTASAVSAKADVWESPLFAQDAGATDAYAITLTPAITTYVTGAQYWFKANTANTGAATLNINSLGAKTIVKVAGGITTALSDNDIRAGQWCIVQYDGTNMQFQSTLGNAPGGSGTVTSVAQSFTGGLISVGGSPITSSGTLALTVAGTSGGIPYFSSSSTWASSAALAANALVIGGGAGAAPATTTTGTGILTFLGTPSSANLASALTDETGSGSAVFGTKPVVDFGTSMASDDTYAGTVRSGLNNTGGVTQWDVVYLNSSSQWALADANGSGTYPARGIAVATVSTGNATTVLTRGTIRNDSWTWTPGGTIYLDTTAGGLTQSAPATTGDKVQVIGYALDADTMAVEIGTDYGTAP